MADESRTSGSDSPVITGSSHVQVPLDQFVRAIAREAASTVIENHVKACNVDKIEVRVDKLERRWLALGAFMIGSGLFGGVVGAGFLNYVQRAFGG